MDYSHVNSKDKYTVFCRCTCSFLSSWCLFSFTCDWADIDSCRICHDCWSCLVHWATGTSLALHLLIHSTASLRIRRTLEARRDTKSDSCFSHFRLLQLCFGEIFLQNIPVYYEYPSSGIVNVLSLSCWAHEMQWQVQSCSSCGWGVRVQKRGKDSGKSSLFLEEIRISDLLASMASRLQSSFLLYMMLWGEGIRAWRAMYWVGCRSVTPDFQSCQKKLLFF